VEVEDCVDSEDTDEEGARVVEVVVELGGSVEEFDVENDVEVLVFEVEVVVVGVVSDEVLVRVEMDGDSVEDVRVVEIDEFIAS